MAKSKRVNKAAATREAIAANPNASAKEIVDILKKKKVSISTAMVYNARNAAKRKAGKPLLKRGLKKGSKRGAKTTATRVAATTTATTSINAALLLTEFGSVEAAVAAVKLADKIRNV